MGQPASRSPQDRGRVGPLQFPTQPSDRSTPPTPTSSSAPAPRSRCLPWPSPCSYGLGSLYPRSHGQNDDVAGFASCCGPADCSTPLRGRPLDRHRGLRYRGPWRLLGPDSHRLADVSLSLDHLMSSGHFSFRSRRPSFWTHNCSLLENSQSGRRDSNPR